MVKKTVPIKYTDRDFDSIKSSLVDHAKRYYPNSFKDFNEASFGSLMLDTVTARSRVGKRSLRSGPEPFSPPRSSPRQAA